MKRAGFVSLVFVLLAGALVAHADAATGYSKKVSRRAVVGYDNPTLGLASGTGGAACFPCPSFEISKTESWTKMEVHDAVSPAPVAFNITQERPDGRCCAYVAGPFCGSTGRRPVELSPGFDVFVFVFAFGDSTCPGAVGTTGTVRAVFSNAP